MELDFALEKKEIIDAIRNNADILYPEITSSFFGGRAINYFIHFDHINEKQSNFKVFLDDKNLSNFLENLSINKDNHLKFDYDDDKTNFFCFEYNKKSFFICNTTIFNDALFATKKKDYAFISTEIIFNALNNVLVKIENFFFLGYFEDESKSFIYFVLDEIKLNKEKFKKNLTNFFDHFYDEKEVMDFRKPQEYFNVTEYHLSKISKNFDDKIINIAFSKIANNNNDFLVKMLMKCYESNGLIKIYGPELISFFEENMSNPRCKKIPPTFIFFVPNKMINNRRFELFYNLKNGNLAFKIRNCRIKNGNIENGDIENDIKINKKYNDFFLLFMQKMEISAWLENNNICINPCSKYSIKLLLQILKCLSIVFYPIKEYIHNFNYVIETLMWKRSENFIYENTISFFDMFIFELNDESANIIIQPDYINKIHDKINVNKEGTIHMNHIFKDGETILDFLLEALLIKKNIENNGNLESDSKRMKAEYNICKVCNLKVL